MVDKTKLKAAMDAETKFASMTDQQVADTFNTEKINIDAELSPTEIRSAIDWDEYKTLSELQIAQLGLFIAEGYGSSLAGKVYTDMVADLFPATLRVKSNAKLNSLATIQKTRTEILGAAKIAEDHVRAARRKPVRTVADFLPERRLSLQAKKSKYEARHAAEVARGIQPDEDAENIRQAELTRMQNAINKVTQLLANDPKGS